MSTLLKLLLLPAAFVAGIVGVALAGDGTPASPGPSVVSTATTDAATTTTDAATTTTDAVTTTETTPAGVDISGPCDEAENANDARCTGAAGARRDSSGPGPGRDDDRGGGRGRGRSGEGR